jgi:hypothetical protein
VSFAGSRPPTASARTRVRAGWSYATSTSSQRRLPLAGPGLPPPTHGDAPYCIGARVATCVAADARVLFLIAFGQGSEPAPEDGFSDIQSRRDNVPADAMSPAPTIRGWESPQDPIVAGARLRGVVRPLRGPASASSPRSHPRSSQPPAAVTSRPDPRLSTPAAFFDAHLHEVVGGG